MLLFFFATWRQKLQLCAKLDHRDLCQSPQSTISELLRAGGINCIRLRASLPSKPVVSLLFPSFSESAHLFLTPEAPNTRPLAQFNLKSSTGLVLYEGYLTYWAISYTGSSNQSFQHPKTSSLLWIRRNKMVRTHSWLPFLVRGNISFSQRRMQQ